MVKKKNTHTHTTPIAMYADIHIYICILILSVLEDILKQI